MSHIKNARLVGNLQVAHVMQRGGRARIIIIVKAVRCAEQHIGGLLEDGPTGQYGGVVRLGD